MSSDGSDGNILCDGLYKLTLNHEYAQSLVTLHSNIGLKRVLINEKSSILWHRQLEHISRDKIERLVKNNILENLDFNDFRMCVDCIKRKQIKHTKKGERLLEIIHTDICDHILFHVLLEKDILSLL